MPIDTQKRPINVAVIGCGKMGQNHLRVYGLMKGVRIAAVVDPNSEVANKMAKNYGCLAFSSVEDFLSDGKDSDTVDAASIAAPSSLHSEIGCALLERGIHCLIEKPLALNEDECRKLIDTAKNSDRKILVGHIERFNPAITELSKILSDKPTIHAIEARRMSALSSRITDVDVVMDLMIHDIEVILALVDSPIREVQASSVGNDNGTLPDYVTALLAFENGAIANITASRITENRIRELMITSDIGCISVDYSTQDILVNRQNTAQQMVSGGSYIFDLSVNRVLVRHSEPLMFEIQHFIDCIANDRAPLINGDAALEALRIAWKVQDKVYQTQ